MTATAPVNISDLKTQATTRLPTVTPGFGDLASFELMQRGAKVLSSSSLVPKQYQGPENLPNAIVALNMALRMNADPLMVMQNLYVVHGRPAWSAQFLIACFNKCGRYSALRYSWEGHRGKDDWGCRAWATELASGERIEGPLVTMATAKAEGWINRDGSKWKTIPELMLTYRAASWMVRTNAPEIAMGLPTAEEAEDVVTLSPAQYSVEQVRASEHAAAPQPAQASTPPPSDSRPPLELDGAPPVITFAMVMAAINEAQTLDILELASDMIPCVIDERQRAELDVEARARRKELAK